MSKFQISPCPYLPVLQHDLPIDYSRKYRAKCGEEYYFACLEQAQSLWQCGKPAQAILQLNKSMMANVQRDSEVLKSYPIPYKALVWFLKMRPEGIFIGNPVRHFQHLASRMNSNQPQPELRSARAWACFCLSKTLLNETEFPRDDRQIQVEQLHIPEIAEILASVVELSPHEDEVRWYKQAEESI